MKKVYFIGSGYECIKFIFVEADTDGDALEKALEWYEATGQNFHYMELDVAKCL